MKRLLVHIVVIIVSAIVGGYLARNLHADQAKKSNPAFSSALAGFNKFASDIQWMLFVNYSATIKTVDAENAPIVYKKLKAITDNDPSFEKAYEMGSLMLAVEAPEKALEILDKGIENSKLAKNWKIPFYAGYIAGRHLPENDKNALDRAEKYFKIAVERSGGTEKHIISQLIHIKARKLMGKVFNHKQSGKSVPITGNKQARLVAIYNEWKLSRNVKNSESSSESYEIPINFEDMMFSTMRSAKTSDAGDKNLQETVSILKQEVFNDRHLCENCLAPYSAGDKFCSSCGVSVEVYGMCPKCGSTLKGRYCSNCGTDSSQAK